MSKFMKSLAVLSVLVIGAFATNANAQVDRAFDSGAVDDYEKYSKALISYAEKGDATDALKNGEQMMKSLDAIHRFIRDTPSKLNSAKLNALAQSAAKTVQRLVAAKNEGSKLVAKLKRASAICRGVRSSS